MRTLIFEGVATWVIKAIEGEISSNCGILQISSTANKYYLVYTTVLVIQMKR